MCSLCVLAVVMCGLAALMHALLLAWGCVGGGLFHVRFLRVVIAYVFDHLLLGVCLHASCRVLFLGPIVRFLFHCLLFIYF